MQKLIASLFVLFALVNPAFAGGDPDKSPDESMITIGTAALAQDEKAVQVLIAVDGSLKISDYGGNYFIIASIKSMVGSDGKTLSYLDIKLDTLGYGYFDSNTVDGKLVHQGDANVFIEASLLRLNVKRDLALDMGQFMRMSVVGISGGAAIKPAEELTVYANAAIDFALYGATTRLSDSAGFEGYRGGAASAEIGFKIRDRFQVSFGAEVQVMKKLIASNTYDTGRDSCHTHSTGGYCDSYVCYYDDYGYEHCSCEYYVSTSSETICDDIYQTDEYFQRAKYSSVYAQVSVRLTKSLTAFGRAEYVVYKVSQDRVPAGVSSPSTSPNVADSRKSGMEFKVGVLYKF